jgi:DNA-binding HxlR family transcriptional regulator
VFQPAGTAPRERKPVEELNRELRITVSDPYSILHELECPGTLEILMLLDQEGRTNPSRMRQRLRPGPKAIARALKALVRARLIRPVKPELFPFAHNYELTERGKELAATMRSWPVILVE